MNEDAPAAHQYTANTLSRRHNLLRGPKASGDSHSTPSHHAIANAPVLTGDAFLLAGARDFPQRALYGHVLEQIAPGFPSKVESSEVFVNINTPFSAVICGVQGSGKSHSTNVILESCLIQNKHLGKLGTPLSGLVLYLDAAGGETARPCEAAYLAALGTPSRVKADPPEVVVLVMPKELDRMRELYSRIQNIKVKPFRIATADLNASHLLAMMRVGTTSQVPLYIATIMAYLRSHEGPLDYAELITKIDGMNFTKEQRQFLDQRLSLLEACLEGGTPNNHVPAYFGSGKLVIVDLSSPFMDSESATGIFEVVLGLFNDCAVDAGKIVVLDEAHKYLSGTNSQRLTDALLSTVREQRHLGMRVVISTQEPNVVPPKFLELSSFVIAHRFTSPKWLHHLRAHVSAAAEAYELLAKMAVLSEGEAFVFSPTALTVKPRSSSDATASAAEGVVRPLGMGFLHVQSRLRITQDGGQSVLAREAGSAAGRSTISLSAFEQDEAGSRSPSPGQSEQALDIRATGTSLWTRALPLHQGSGAQIRTTAHASRSFQPSTVSRARQLLGDRSHASGAPSDVAAAVHRETTPGSSVSRPLIGPVQRTSRGEPFFEAFNEVVSNITSNMRVELSGLASLFNPGDPSSSGMKPRTYTLDLDRGGRVVESTAVHSSTSVSRAGRNVERGRPARNTSALSQIGGGADAEDAESRVGSYAYKRSHASLEDGERGVENGGPGPSKRRRDELGRYMPDEASSTRKTQTGDSVRGSTAGIDRGRSESMRSSRASRS